MTNDQNIFIQQAELHIHFDCFLQNDITINDILLFLTYWEKWFPLVFRVMNHRRHKNLLTKSVAHSTMSHICHFLGSYHNLTSSVIYYSTDTWEHGIYLLIRAWQQPPMVECICLSRVSFKINVDKVYTEKLTDDHFYQQ